MKEWAAQLMSLQIGSQLPRLTIIDEIWIIERGHNNRLGPMVRDRERSRKRVRQTTMIESACACVRVLKSSKRCYGGHCSSSSRLESKCKQHKQRTAEEGAKKPTAQLPPLTQLFHDTKTDMDRKKNEI